MFTLLLKQSQVKGVSMNNIVLGRYTPYNSFLHKLDPRNKIVCLILLMVALFFQFNIAGTSITDFPMTFIVEGALFLIVLLAMLISHVSIKSFFKSLMAMWFVILLLLIVNIFVVISPSNGDFTTTMYYYYGEAFRIQISAWGWDYPIYWASIFQSLKIVIRLIVMISLTMVLTATTKPLDLTLAFEWFMTPLKLIRFPAHEIAMTLSIALRFIPTLLDETERIMKAQSSRGVDFKHGKLSSRIKAITALIIPLFISAFQRSEELADAMEARGYNPRAKRTHYHKLTWSFFDSVIILLSAAILTGVIFISVLNIAYTTPTFLGWLFVSMAGLITLFILLGISFNYVENKKGAK